MLLLCVYLQEENMNKYIITILGTGLNALVGLVIIPILTRIYSPTVFAETVVLQSYCSLIYIGFSLGLENYLIRFFYGTNQSQRNELINTLIFISLTLILCVFLCSLLFAFDYINYFRMGLIYSFFYLFFKFKIQYLRLEEKLTKYFCLQLVQKIYLIAFVIVINKFLVMEDIHGFFFALILSIFFSNMTNGISLNYKITGLSVSFIRRVLRYSVPICISMLIFSLVENFDKVLIGAKFFDFNTDNYLISFKIASIVTLIYQVVITLWTPLAFKWHDSKVAQGKYVNVFILLSILLIIFYFAFSISVHYLHLIFGNEYKKSFSLAKILVINPILLILSEILVVGVYFKEKTKYPIYSSSLSFLVLCLLLIFLSKDYESVGIAYSTVFAYLTLYYSRWFFSYKVGYKIPGLLVSIPPIFIVSSSFYF
jgi:O-antigen/teichoic acid export membrane protein